VGPRGAVSAAGLVILIAVAALGPGCGHGSAPRGHSLHVVTIRRIAFAPPLVTLAPGDTIEWRNRDLVPHTVSARNDAWDSGSLAPDSSWRLVASQAGSFAYFCRFHTNMHGTVAIARSR